MNERRIIIFLSGSIVALLLLLIYFVIPLDETNYVQQTTPITAGTEPENTTQPEDSETLIPGSADEHDEAQTLPVKKPTKNPTQQKPPSTSVWTQTQSMAWISDEMAWIYPGTPACNAMTEIVGRDIEFLKPEYFVVAEGGDLRFLTLEIAGCNGFSEASLATVKQYSDYQFITVASSYAGDMDAFLVQNEKTGEHVATLVKFVVDHDVTGIELDFEDFGGWTAESYTRYKSFVTSLGNALHAKGKQLMIDGPATASAEQEAWFVWRYGDFANLPIDYLVVMTYDYQYDQGVGKPVAPYAWIEGALKWAQERFPYPQKLVAGIPSYGYRGTISNNQIELVTYEQSTQIAQSAQAIRDPLSGELMSQQGDSIVIYQDSTSMAEKRRRIEALGVRYISVWHLGGNQWFTKK